VEKVMKIIGVVLCVSLCRIVIGTTLYVDSSVSQSGNGLSWESALKTIQEGIDAASQGDTVTVAEGLYAQNIRFNGKNIVLRSTDPLDQAVVENTIIDGNRAGSVVTFAGTEDESCVISGFTIRNGEAQLPSGKTYGGGIFGGAFLFLPFEGRMRATIRNNVITDCFADRGGGIACCDGLIQDNTISQNSAGRGGGLIYCNGLIQGNTVTANHSYGEGAAGIHACNGIIQNNVISGNMGHDSDGSGALDNCDGIIQNNLIIKNSSEGGVAGLEGCAGLILNNTIVGNSATGEDSVGGLSGCGGIIRNCIVWGNTGGEAIQLGSCTAPAYSCIQDWTGGGEGNTNLSPLFVDPAGDDYHLQSDSPCVNKGVNYYWAAWPQRDLDGNCRLAGERVDMGCYEQNSALDSDGDLLADEDEPAAGTGAADTDTDDDGLRDGLELLRGTDPLAPTQPEIVHVLLKIPTIQKALCLAVNGDEIIAALGIHEENLQFCGADIVLRSLNPGNAGVVSSTILDGGGAGPVVSFTGGESENCVLSGFTIRNGYAIAGAGICGGPEGNPTHATIRNNVIVGNAAQWRGGGLAFCDGAISGNSISGNTSGAGGGLYMCSGAIHDNVISANRASDGGGLYECQGVIRNNTIISNSAGHGGGLAWCSGGAIVNCIIWGNMAEDSPQLYYCHEPTYSCIQGWTGDPIKYGNTAGDPRFARPGFWDDAGTPDDKSDDSWVEGDYHLSLGSPCIDAGDNSATSPSDTDLAGFHRMMFGGKSFRVDMGAYEFYVNDLSRGPNPEQTTFTWSSLAEKTYSIFYSEDLFTWHLAVGGFPSSGDTTTFWIDDGTTTGGLPLLNPRRLYRVMENP
jgi:hypothetical protein